MREKTKRPLLPKFKSEAEEAQWWYDNRSMVEKEFMTAIGNGTVGRGIDSLRSTYEVGDDLNFIGNR
jgi:hypothetical protein